MKRYLRSSLLLTCLFILTTSLLPFLAAPARAQDKSLYWDRYDVNLTVQPDGTLQVEEIQEIEFTDGTFTFGYAAIPMDRVENIRNVSVSEIMPDGTERQYSPNSTADYGFTTAVNEGELQISWYFPPTANSKHTYVLRYTVDGGLRIYPEGDQVWWKAIAPDHNFPINSSTVVVTLPETFPKNELVVEAYGAPIDGANYTDRGAVVFTAGNIPAGEELEVRVQFPHGVVSADPPAWQSADDLRRSMGPIIGVLFGALGLIVLVGGPVGVYILWYTRGRDDDSILAPDYVSEPPSDLPAAIAGTLVDESADMNDIIAAILDLANRGALRMEEQQKKSSLGITNRDFIFHLQDETLATYPHEKRLMKRLFGSDYSKPEIKLADLRQKFYTAIPEIERNLYQEVVDKGYFPSNPETTRQKWRWLAGVGMVVSFGSAFCLLFLVGDFSAAVACPSLGAAVAMIALFFVGGHMPRKTLQGAEEAAKWLAFKQYLENIEEYNDLESVKDQFEKYLPYAMAFGLEKRLIHKFSAIDTPAPGWWGPVLVPYPHGHYHGSPSMGGSGGSLSTSGPPGQLAGEGGGGSLSDMSGNLGGSLSGMSASLGSLLNSAGSTFSSTPPPPKTSSSGGWSGGGFSGGGSFGGGGGGGGSRGFG